MISIRTCSSGPVVITHYILCSGDCCLLLLADFLAGGFGFTEGFGSTGLAPLGRCLGPAAVVSVTFDDVVDEVE